MKRLLLGFLLVAFLAPALYGQVETTSVNWEPFTGTDPITGTTLVGFGYARYSVTVVTNLAATPAAGNAIHRLARHAILAVEAGSIRVRFDGTAPTATEGELLSTGEKRTFENQRAMLLALQMISTAGAATVTITYAR